MTEDFASKCTRLLRHFLDEKPDAVSFNYIEDTEQLPIEFMDYSKPRLMCGDDADVFYFHTGELLAWWRFYGCLPTMSNAQAAELCHVRFQRTDKKWKMTKCIYRHDLSLLEVQDRLVNPFNGTSAERRALWLTIDWIIAHPAQPDLF